MKGRPRDAAAGNGGTAMKGRFIRTRFSHGFPLCGRWRCGRRRFYLRNGEDGAETFAMAARTR